MGKLKVLFLGARPRDAASLRLKEEIHRVTYRLSKAGYGDRVEYIDEWAVQFSDLPGLLLKHRPQIVHFSGHGTAQEDLIFEDDLGQTQPVPREAMIATFRVGALQRAVRCVVINACYSSSVAAGIAGSIDFVIGSGAAITDAAAIAFTEAFYQVLAHGESMQDAFEMARAQFLAVSKPDAALPTLIVRQGADPRHPLLPGEDHRVETLLASDAVQLPGITVSPPLIFRLPTRASVRRLMDAVLVSQVDVECFCSDHFFAVKRQYFQPQMDRLRMAAILLDYVSPAEVLERLTEDYPDAVRQHAHLLRYE